MAPSHAVFISLVLGGLAAPLVAADRTEHFDRDPGWEGYNNRATSPPPREVLQDFGYSPTAHAGGSRGEMGGYITPAAEPAYYAKRIPERTFGDQLMASGRVACPGREFHVLVGFFNANTINEWRTPNSIALRFYGRGDIFYAYVEYTTARWRAGGDSPGGFSEIRDPASGRARLKGFVSKGAVHAWSLRYDPNGHDGAGSVTVTLDDETAVCHLGAGHKNDGAAFNRFGLINVVKQVDGGGEVWLDDVTVDGVKESFDEDPHWDEFQNRRSYSTFNVRPRFDFGYTPTAKSGGRSPGEMGGQVYRGDGRYTNMMAFYGDRLKDLNLEKPLRASGRIGLHRGVSDSDVLLGFFHAEHSLDSGGSDGRGTPPDFLGVSIGGPSREGFMFLPAYGLHNRERTTLGMGPHILPNGAAHDWNFEYQPNATDGSGTLTVTLDGKRASLVIPRDHRAAGAHFNRFGIISTHTDGNSQLIFFDDLTYTRTQD